MLLFFLVDEDVNLPDQRHPRRSQIPEERHPRRSQIPEERRPRRSIVKNQCFNVAFFCG